jgi:hypothetical protein
MFESGILLKLSQHVIEGVKEFVIVHNCTYIIQRNNNNYYNYNYYY